MGLQALRESIPDFAKDIRLNLGTVLDQIELSLVARWGCALATALAVGEAVTLAHIREEAKIHLSEGEYKAVETAVALMSMNNIYYRFLHLAQDEDLSKAPARLRMSGMRREEGEDSELFELWSLVVSAVYGCGRCIESHLALLRSKGMSNEAVLAAIRIGAVVHAAARVLASQENSFS